MDNRRQLRRILWFSGWLLFAPAVAIAWRTGHTWLAAIALLAMFACAYFSLTKTVCPQCGFATWTIGAVVTECRKCGAKLEKTA
jgi:ribosomal protein L40E